MQRQLPFRRFRTRTALGPAARHGAAGRRRRVVVVRRNGHGLGDRRRLRCDLGEGLDALAELEPHPLNHDGGLTGARAADEKHGAPLAQRDDEVFGLIGQERELRRR